MSLYSSAILSDSPLAYWRLGELSGASAADSSGNGKTGAYTGTFALGQAGAIAGDNDAAAKFDGSSSYVAAPAFALLSNWTAEAWVKPNGNQLQDAAILTDVYTGGLKVNYVICFNHDAAAAAPLSVYAGYFDGSAWHITAGFALTSGVWSHVAGTYDGANLMLYVNGQLRSSVASAAAPVLSGVASRIGRSWDNASAGYVNGMIDEAALYGTALSASRILAHYNAGISQSPAAPVIGATLVGR